MSNLFQRQWRTSTFAKRTVFHCRLPQSDSLRKRTLINHVPSVHHLQCGVSPIPPKQRGDLHVIPPTKPESPHSKRKTTAGRSQISPFSDLHFDLRSRYQQRLKNPIHSLELTWLRDVTWMAWPRKEDHWPLHNRWCST